MGRTLLSERIIEKCRQQKWYGGEKSNTARYTQRNERYEACYRPDGTLMIDHDPDDYPRKSSFAYAPATQTQLLATGLALGFPLPELLCILYLELANGGFGPGYGLHGALGGFDQAGNLVDGYSFHLARSELIDLEVSTSTGSLSYPLELPNSVWPRYLLHLCDWHAATTSCLDAATERIYLCRPSPTSPHSFTLQLEALSLSRWLELWLAGELQDKGEVSKIQSSQVLEPESALVLYYTSEDPDLD